MKYLEDNKIKNEVIEKLIEKLENYEDMLIYERDNVLYFGNKKYTSSRAKSIRSAKNLITRYINKLTSKNKRSLKYLKYEI